MSFNHYAKIKRILDSHDGGWYISKINSQTKAKKFNGEITTYPYYYRIMDLKTDEPIKFCKFQQIDRLAKILNASVEDLPIL